MGLKGVSRCQRHPKASSEPSSVPSLSAKLLGGGFFSIDDGPGVGAPVVTSDVEPEQQVQMAAPGCRWSEGIQSAQKTGHLSDLKACFAFKSHENI